MPLSELPDVKALEPQYITMDSAYFSDATTISERASMISRSSNKPLGRSLS